MKSSKNYAVCIYCLARDTDSGTVTSNIKRAAFAGLMNRRAERLILCEVGTVESRATRHVYINETWHVGLHMFRMTVAHAIKAQN